MGRKAKGGGENHLMAWREFRGLTQAQLAESAGTTGAVISLLESGGRPLSDKWLRKFADALDTTPGRLLDHDPNEVNHDLWEAVADVPEERRAEVMEILRVFRRR